MRVLMMVSAFCLFGYVLMLAGTLNSAEYPRKREVPNWYDIMKASIALILGIMCALYWAFREFNLERYFG